MIDSSQSIGGDAQPYKCACGCKPECKEVAWRINKSTPSSAKEHLFEDASANKGLLALSALALVRLQPYRIFYYV